MYIPKIIAFLCYAAIVTAILILITACSPSGHSNSARPNWQQSSVTNKSCNSNPRGDGGATYGFPQRWFGGC